MRFALVLALLWSFVAHADDAPSMRPFSVGGRSAPAGGAFTNPFYAPTGCTTIPYSFSADHNMGMCRALDSEFGAFNSLHLKPGSGLLNLDAYVVGTSYFDLKTQLAFWGTDTSATDPPSVGVYQLHADTAAHRVQLANNGVAYSSVYLFSDLVGPVQMGNTPGSSGIGGGELLSLKYTSGSDYGTGIVVKDRGTNITFAQLVLANDSDKYLRIGVWGSAQSGTIFGLANLQNVAHVINTDASETLAIGTVAASPIVFGTNNLARLTIPTDGGLTLKEAALPAVLSGSDEIAPDSTSHAASLSNNGDAFSPIARYVTAITSADFTTTSATLADVTGLTVSLPIGTWSCDVYGNLSDTTLADGAKWSFGLFSGTTTTATSDTRITDSTGTTITPGPVSLSTTTTDATIAAGGAIGLGHFNGVVTVAGIVKAQAAQAAHTTGTLTVSKGASITCFRL